MSKNVAEKIVKPELSLLEVLRLKLRTINYAIVKMQREKGYDEEMLKELDNYREAYMDVIYIIVNNKFRGVK